MSSNGERVLKTAKAERTARASGSPSVVDTVPAWPNQAEAAAMLRVAQSTLLRANLSLAMVPAGGKEKRVPPTEVLRAAMHFRRVPLRSVMGELLDLARRKFPGLVADVEAELNLAVADSVRRTNYDTAAVPVASRDRGTRRVIRAEKRPPGRRRSVSRARA